jgi:hypothetical protein
MAGVPNGSFVPAAVVPPPEDLALVEALVLAVCVGVDVEDDVVAGALPLVLVFDELDPPQPQAASVSRMPTTSPIVRISCRFGDAVTRVNPMFPPISLVSIAVRRAASERLGIPREAKATVIRRELAEKDPDDATANPMSLPWETARVAAHVQGYRCLIEVVADSALGFAGRAGNRTP